MAGAFEGDQVISLHPDRYLLTQVKVQVAPEQGLKFSVF
jgi:hypothetical protein